MYYDVILRRIRLTAVAVKKQYYIFRERVFVALGSQHEICVRHIVNCGLPASTKYFLIIP
jgi:hypothetical protein